MKEFASPHAAGLGLCGSILRPTLANKIGLLLLLPLLTSIFGSGCFIWHIVTTRADIHFINAAGYQRLRASELKDWIEMVGHGQDEDRAGLRSKIKEFEVNITAMRFGGETSRGNIAPAPAEIQNELAILMRDWEVLKKDILPLTSASRRDAESRDAMRRGLEACDKLRDRADDVVSAFEARANRLRRRMLWILAAIAGLNFAVFFVGMMLVRRRVIRPLLDLGAAVKRVSDGDFSRRVPVEAQDEMATLAYAFNEMCARIQRLVAELQEDDLRFRQLTENIDEVFWMTAPDNSQLLYVSPAYERIWGRTCAELYAESGDWLNSIHAEDRDRLRQAAREKRVLGQYDEKYRITRPDGSLRWIRDRAFPVKDASGTVYRIVGVAEDITDRIRLEKELHAREFELLHAQKMEALGRLASGIAHDFNNNLSSIMGLCDLLVLQLLPENSARRDVEDIKAAAERSAALTRQLLAFGRKQAANPKIYDANALIAREHGILARMVGADIRFELLPSKEVLPISIDLNQFDQILMNLVLNARDAMTKGGVVTISASAVGSDVDITVRDTGGGIEKKVLSHIFEPFFTTKENVGTGLGLSIVHGIVTQSGGRVEVESEVGKGTAFRLFFPRAAGEIDQAAPVPTVNPKIAMRLILVVEDDPILLRVMSRYLENSGCQVLAADGAQRAISFFSENPTGIDLVITDVNMPGTNGMVLAKKLKSLRPGVKILFISGHGLDVLSFPDWPQGAQILPKPFELDVFAKKINEMLSAGSA